MVGAKPIPAIDAQRIAAGSVVEAIERPTTIGVLSLGECTSLRPTCFDPIVIGSESIATPVDKLAYAAIDVRINDLDHTRDSVLVIEVVAGPDQW